MALRTSTSIIKRVHPFPERIEGTQHTPAEQMGLGIKGATFQPRVLAFPHPPPQVLAHDLEIPQQHTFEFVAALDVVRHTLHLRQGPAQLARSDRFPQRGGPWEERGAHSSVPRPPRRRPASRL